MSLFILDELYRHYIPSKNYYKPYLEAAKRSILTRNTKYNKQLSNSAKQNTNGSRKSTQDNNDTRISTDDTHE